MAAAFAVFGFLLLTSFESSGADPPTTKANATRMTNSAFVVLPREIPASFKRIHGFIADGKHGLAVAELAELARNQADQLVLINADSSLEHYKAVHLRVTELLRRLPVSSQKLYERQSADRAKAQLQDALKSKKTAELVAIVLRFPETNARRSALKHLAARHMDAAAWRPAIGALQMLHADSATTKNYKDALQNRIAMCRSQLTKYSAAVSIPQTASFFRERSDLRKLAGDGQTIERLNSEDIALRAHVVPSLAARTWLNNSHATPEWKVTVLPAIQEHRDQAIAILPRAKPVLYGDVLLVRTTSGMLALNRRTGVQLWQRDANSSTQFGARALYVRSLKGLLAKSLSREIQLDTVHSAMTIVGSNVCYVQAIAEALTKPARPSKLMPLTSRLPTAATNQLISRDIKTGNLTWSLTGQMLSRQQNKAELPTFFLGSPVVHENQLYGVAQRGENVLLYVLSTTGDLLWSCKLVTTSRQDPADLDWRAYACPVLLTDGIAVCTTTAGTVVGVDLLTRSRRWIHRYERQDTPADDRRKQPNRKSRHWWLGWRAAKLMPLEFSNAQLAAGVSGGATNKRVPAGVLFVSPDLHSAVALNSSSGEQLWKRSVSEPIEVLDAGPDSVVVLSRHQATSYDSISGKLQWQIETPEPGGQGFMVQQDLPADERPATKPGNSKELAKPRQQQRRVYVYPTTSQKMCLLDVSVGQVEFSSVTLDGLGNFQLHENQIVMQGLDHVAAWPTLDHVLNIGERIAGQDLMARKRMTAKQLHSIGLVETADESLADVLLELGQRDPPVTAPIRQIAKERIEGWNDWPLQNDVSDKRLAAAVEFLKRESTVTPARQSIEAWIALARTARRNQNLKLSTFAYLEALKLNPEGYSVVYDNGPTRRVLKEPLIQGELLSMEETLPIHESLGFDARRVAELQDPFAIQRVILQRRMLDRTLQLRDEARIGLPFYQQQLDVLALTRLADHEPHRKTNGRLSTCSLASHLLAKLYESRSYTKDALFWKLKLKQTPLAELADKERINFPPSKTNLELSLSESEWLPGAPRVETKGQPARNVMQLVQLSARAGSPFSRLSVFVSKPQRSGQSVVFCGDGHAGHWRLTLPRSDSPFRQIVQPQAWGIGQFVVLRLGTELFGIAPFAPNGEPRPRLIWSRNLAPNAAIGGIRIHDETPGVRPTRIEFLDAFDRSVGQVGPVLPGFVCYRTKGKLYCLQTGTGKLLWGRNEVPQAATVVGDSDYVYLVTNDKSGWRTQVLRAADGSLTKEHKLQHETNTEQQQVWVANDRMFVVSKTESNGAATRRLRVIWLVNGQRCWATQFGENDRVFAVDEDRIGLARAQSVVLLDINTGKQVEEINIDLTKISKVFSIQDGSQIYVVYSRKTQEEARPRQLWPNPNEYVDGGILAINRWTLKKQWHKKLENEYVNWSQPNGVPFLVCSYQQAESEATIDQARTIFHLIDKRSGATLFREAQAVRDEQYIIEPNAPQKWIRLRTTNRFIQLDYSRSN